MGLIAMSERDLQRIEILSKVIAGRMTVVSAAHVLDLSERQGRRRPGTRPRRPFCVAVSTDPIDARYFLGRPMSAPSMPVRSCRRSG